jgi:hypothetical protein
MRISEAKFREAGILEKERLVFQVLQDDDIGRYAVFHTRLLRGEAVSSTVRHTFWFPDRAVKKGDVVVLYTKSGTSSEKANDDNTTSYFFYWNVSTPLWNVKGECAVLVSIERWNKAVSDASPL